MPILTPGDLKKIITPKDIDIPPEIRPWLAWVTNNTNEINEAFARKEFRLVCELIALSKSIIETHNLQQYLEPKSSPDY